MFTPREIRDTEFERVSRGYKVEDVDGFLSHLADQIEQLMAQKAESDRQLAAASERLEQYRQEEGALRNAMISAERLKENILAEATQQQEILLRDAQQKADRIVGDVESKIEREEATLAALKQQVAAFKSEVLNIYKSHLELLSDLPNERSDTDYEHLVMEQPAPAVAPRAYSAPVAPIEPIAQEIPAPIEPAVQAAPAGQTEQLFYENAPAYEGFAPKVAEPAPPAFNVPPVENSVFASFAVDNAAQPAASAEESRFGKLDFGENFSFGRD